MLRDAFKSLYAAWTSRRRLISDVCQEIISCCRDDQLQWSENIPSATKIIPYHGTASVNDVI